MADLEHKYLTDKVQLDFSKCRGSLMTILQTWLVGTTICSKKSKKNKFAKFISCAG